MRTLFIGSTRRGYLTLQAMLDAGVNVVGVLSLAEHAHEKDSYETAIRDLATARGMALRETMLAREPDLAPWMQSLDADAAIAVGVRVLLPETLYSIFPRGCWAVHDSLLPEYRGFAPMNWALINGEQTTGVTLFQISDAMDEGDILLQKRVPIGEGETAPELYVKICEATVNVVLLGCELLRSGTPELRVQDHSAASYTCSRAPADGFIDWTLATVAIFNLIRALTFPYPGAFTYCGDTRLYVLAARLIAEPGRYVGRIPGRVVQILSTGEVDVLTGDGILRITQISTDGETARKPAEVIRSVRARLGIDHVAMASRLAALETALAAGKGQ